MLLAYVNTGAMQTCKYKTCEECNRDLKYGWCPIMVPSPDALSRCSLLFHSHGLLLFAGTRCLHFVLPFQPFS